MKLVKFLSIMAAAAASVCLVSCKKDDDKKTSESFDETVYFGHMPDYVIGGEKYDFKVREFDCTGKVGVGYYWVCYPMHSAYDTLKTAKEPAGKEMKFSITIPSDTTCTVTVVVGAFAKGYYSTSTTLSAIIVDPALNTGTVTDFDLIAGNPSFTDPRDSKVYLTAEIGDLVWMRQNLAWEGAGAPFDNARAMKDIYGMYYTWNESKTACPSGWRVPTEADWRNLAAACGADPGADFKDFKGISGALMVNAKFNGEPMWEFWPAVKITDKSGFAAMPTRYASVADSEYTFSKNLKYGAWWTASESLGLGVYRYIYEDKPDVYAGTADKDSFALPVRCVRDK